jgi:hypothetical protein
MSVNDLPIHVQQNYECYEWKHATAILKNDFPSEWADVMDVLTGFRVCQSYVTAGGGNISLVSQAFNGAFSRRGWVEKKWDTKIVVDETETESPTHKVDCYKNQIALEIEWSNKDPFYDRDLNNFRLLFDLRVISVGIIITKANELNTIFRQLGIYTKYGASTTWMNKLLPRIDGGGGGGCPILVFGIRNSLFDPNC